MTTSGPMICREPGVPTGWRLPIDLVSRGERRTVTLTPQEREEASSG